MNEPKPMSTTMLKKWTRYPANQERRMDAAYSTDDNIVAPGSVWLFWCCLLSALGQPLVP